MGKPFAILTIFDPRRSMTKKMLCGRGLQLLALLM